jgi:hypothetical protein
LSNSDFGTIFQAIDEARSTRVRLKAMEAIMAYLARPAEFHGATPYRPARQPAPARRRGFWRSLVDAFAHAHQRHAEREVAAYVARRGKLTDSMEREIADRIIGGNWGPRL